MRCIGGDQLPPNDANACPIDPKPPWLLLVEVELDDEVDVVLVPDELLLE
jgi:hypothetical protein